MRFDDLQVGQTAERTSTFTATDVDEFARITGDRNPVHVDEAAARESRFGGRIAHGMLTAGLVSAVLGMDLPGPGAIYLGQTLRFTRPVRIGQEITARVEVLELWPEKRRARLATTCMTRDGVVLEGEATVLVSE